MHIDFPTLMLAGGLVALMSGTILVFARYQYREMSPVMWWAGGDFALAAAVLSLAAGGRPPGLAVAVSASGFFTLGPALIWASARRFNGRSAPLPTVLGGPVLLFLLAFFGPFDVVGTLRVVSPTLSAAYYVAAAWTLVAAAREPLRARWPLAILCGVHALALVIMIPQMLFLGSLEVARGILLNSIHFESLAFLLGTTIFVVAAMRESSEFRYKLAADTDGLTGLLNRRGFLEKARRVLGRCRYDSTSCAMVVFDLDRFKTINDTHGHAAGDRALQVFAEAARTVLRPTDVLGRIGGEEFAAVLSGAGIEAGCAMADRIRKAFAEARIIVDSTIVSATLSAGVSALSAADDVQALMRRADSALYKAKLRGRNRVESADAREAEAAKLVRLA